MHFTATYMCTHTHTHTHIHCASQFMRKMISVVNSTIITYHQGQVLRWQLCCIRCCTCSARCCHCLIDLHVLTVVTLSDLFAQTALCFCAFWHLWLNSPCQSSLRKHVSSCLPLSSQVWCLCHSVYFKPTCYKVMRGYRKEAVLVVKRNRHSLWRFICLEWH